MLAASPLILGYDATTSSNVCVHCTYKIDPILCKKKHSNTGFVVGPMPSVHVCSVTNVFTFQLACCIKLEVAETQILHKTIYIWILRRYAVSVSPSQAVFYQNVSSREQRRTISYRVSSFLMANVFVKFQWGHPNTWGRKIVLHTYCE